MEEKAFFFELTRIRWREYSSRGGDWQPTFFFFLWHSRVNSITSPHHRNSNTHWEIFLRLEKKERLNNPECFSVFWCGSPEKTVPILLLLHPPDKSDDDLATFSWMAATKKKTRFDYRRRTLPYSSCSSAYFSDVNNLNSNGVVVVAGRDGGQKRRRESGFSFSFSLPTCIHWPPFSPAFSSVSVALCWCVLFGLDLHSRGPVSAPPAAGTDTHEEDEGKTRSPVGTSSFLWYSCTFYLLQAAPTSPKVKRKKPRRADRYTRVFFSFSCPRAQPTNCWARHLLNLQLLYFFFFFFFFQFWPVLCDALCLAGWLMI